MTPTTFFFAKTSQDQPRPIPDKYYSSAGEALALNEEAVGSTSPHTLTWLTTMAQTNPGEWRKIRQIPLTQSAAPSGLAEKKQWDL